MTTPLAKELSNGLKIVFVPYPSVESVTICLRGLAGSNYESTSEIGVAHLLEHYVTLNQSKYLVTKNGGRITGTTSRDEVAFLTKTLKEYYEDGLEFLADIFYKPVLDPNDLEKVKGSISQEILQNSENPQLYIGRLAYKTLFPNQRISELNTGNVKHVSLIDYEVLVSFWEKMYKPANFVLVASGNIEPSKFMRSATKYFAQGLKSKRTAKPKLKQYDEFLVQVEKRKEIGQLHVRVDYYSFKTNSVEKYAALVLGKVMQNELSTQLTNNKDVNFYTLNVMSFSSNTYGLFTTYAAINTHGLFRFFKTFNMVLDYLKSNCISEDTLSTTKMRLKADFEFSYEKTSLRADLYSELTLFDQVETNHTKDLERYLAVTQKEILKVAKRLFSQKPKITVIDKELTQQNVKDLFIQSKF